METEMVAISEKTIGKDIKKTFLVLLFYHHDFHKKDSSFLRKKDKRIN